MKRLTFIVCIAISTFLISCNNESASISGNSSEEQKNISADSIIGEAFRTGDVSKIDSVVAPDFVDHSDMGEMNRDSLKSMINMIHTKMADMKMEKVRIAADGDHVYSWMKYTGTSDEGGMMPKGQHYNMNVIELTRFKDGKAVEHWAFLDMRDMKQFMPQGNMNMGTPADSSKMKTK